MKIMKRMKKNCPLAALFPNFMTFMPCYGEYALGSRQIPRDQEV